MTGDIIKVIRADLTGWSEGINLRSDDIGWFPATYIRELTEDDAEFTQQKDELLSNPEYMKQLTEQDPKFEWCRNQMCRDSKEKGGT